MVIVLIIVNILILLEMPVSFKIFYIEKKIFWNGQYCTYSTLLRIITANYKTCCISTMMYSLGNCSNKHN